MSELVPDLRRCTATRTDGEPCERWAIRGGKVCPTHGGAAPQVKAAARRRLQRERLTAEVAELLDELDPEEPQHPVQVILDAVHRSASVSRLLEQLVGMLAPTFDAERLDDRGRMVAALWGPNHLGDGSPHALVNLLGEWTDRQARLAKSALDANVDEQRLRLAQREMETIAAAIRDAKGAADLTAEQESRFDQELASSLSARQVEQHD